MPRHIRVAVLALTYGQHESLLPAEFKDSVLSARATYDCLTKGSVYGDTPDDWSPYENGTSVLKYLSGDDFEVNSLSSYLQKKDRWFELANKAELYLIDPIFLAHSDHIELVATLDGAIGTNASKGACVLLPQRMPEALRRVSQEICLQRLRLTFEAYKDEGRGEWLADADLRLKAYLKRFDGARKETPTADALEAVRALLLNQGVQTLTLPKSPRLGSR